MASTGLVLDLAFARHLTSPGHPERPERVQAIDDYLEQTGLAERCRRIAPEPASAAMLELNHSAEYLERFRRDCAGGQSWLDTPDCSMSEATYETALLAAGAVLKAVDAVQRGALRNAFCAVRPPGHHAEYDRAMGFCFLNHIALAARRLLAVHGLRRVLILDWDVHQGNGTFHSFEEDNRVFFCSLHGHPDYLYPGIGRADQRGRGRGEGFSLNIPLMPGTSDAQYRRAFEERFLPAADNFAPEFVLISAGFDAHRGDPLSILGVETDTFAWMTREVRRLAEKHCAGRIVSTLEGGYNLRELARAAAAHLGALLE